MISRALFIWCLILGVGSSCGTLSASTPKTAPVRIAPAVMKEIAAAKTFIGTVEAARKSTVGSAVAGRVSIVNVETGDLVDPALEGGAKLIQLRLNTVQIGLRAAKAALEVSQQELAEMEKGPREEELRRLEAVMKGAEATRQFATIKLRRLEKLYGRDATARATLDEATAAMTAADQAYEAAKANYEAANAGTRKEQIAQAQAKVAQAQEEVNRLQDQVDDHTIRAPFRGYVIARHVERGEWVPQGAPIADIIQLDPVEVLVLIPEEYISRVSVGMDVRVDVASVRSEVDGVITGTVFRVVPSADARSRSFPVRIRIDNPEVNGAPLLKPGMLARVSLPVGKAEETLMVPKDALVLDRAAAWLFTIEAQADSKLVRRVNVQVGTAQDSMIQVRPERGAGMQADSLVVTEGNERLTDGQTVRVIE